MVLIDMEMPKSCMECKLTDSEHCTCVVMNFWQDKYYVGCFDKKRAPWCPLKPFTPPEPQITTNIYDTEEIHHGCTVQILRNSVTGEVSVGWWEEKEEEE